MTVTGLSPAKTGGDSNAVDDDDDDAPDHAHLEAVLVAADEARVAAAVAAAAGGHDSCLRKDAAAAVVSAGEGDRVLVVVGEVEVAGEPALDLVVLADGLDELLARDLVVVVQPAAAVDDVAFLDTQMKHGRSVSGACCHAMLCEASLNAAMPLIWDKCMSSCHP